MVPLAWDGDSNGHQASFQTEGGSGFGEEGVQAVREVMRTIHPLSDVSGTREVKKKLKKKKLLKNWKLSLK